MGAIIVGIDGSDGSRRALQWAVEEARLRRCPVEAIYIYDHTPAWALYGYAEGSAAALAEAAGADDEDAIAQDRAHNLAKRLVDELGDTGGVAIAPIAIPSRRPAVSLVERSEDAQMLVVGSRGRGGFSGLLLGSVSQQVAHHSQCPVVILGPVDPH